LLKRCHRHHLSSPEAQSVKSFVSKFGGTVSTSKATDAKRNYTAPKYQSQLSQVLIQVACLRLLSAENGPGDKENAPMVSCEFEVSP